MLGSLLTAVLLAQVVAASILLYLLPALIGWARHVPDIGAVAAVNILLGWTLVCWVVALALALRTVKSASPVVQVVQNLPPVPSRPAPMPPAGWDGLPGPPPPRPRHAAPPLNLPPGPAGSGEPAGRG